MLLKNIKKNKRYINRIMKLQINSRKFVSICNGVENINLIGMKKDKAEAMEILSEFVPKVQKFSAKVNSYKDYIRELEIKVVNQKYDNKELIEENNELKKQMGHKDIETTENYYISSTDETRRNVTDSYENAINLDVIEEIIEYKIFI